jgi:outer membrane receptor protein involved in Fe transport
LQYEPVTQEAVTSYETGIKADLFNRRAHVNAAAFYDNYQNKQILGSKDIPPFGINPVLVNVPASRIFGLESDVTIKPTRNLTLTGSVTYLDTRIQRYSGIDAIGNPVDLAGNNLPFAPELSYNIDAEYRGEFANGGTPFIGISVTGQSTEDTTIGGSSFTLVPGPLVRIEPGLIYPYTTNPYSTVDLRVGYEAPGSPWRVMLFGKNIFNKYYWNNVNATETIVRFAGAPATYGVTFGFKFK